jgi:hypothetical protein
MNDPVPTMPSDFGLRYVLWIAWRWVYYNPLTILSVAQGVIFQLALDNPAVHWIGTAASVSGIVIAQIRNRGKDYTVPILSKPITPAAPAPEKP